MRSTSDTRPIWVTAWNEETGDIGTWGPLPHSVCEWRTISPSCSSSCLVPPPPETWLHVRSPTRDQKQQSKARQPLYLPKDEDGDVVMQARSDSLSEFRLAAWFHARPMCDCGQVKAAPATHAAIPAVDKSKAVKKSRKRSRPKPKPIAVAVDAGIGQSGDLDIEWPNKRPRNAIEASVLAAAAESEDAEMKDSSILSDGAFILDCWKRLGVAPEWSPPLSEKTTEHERKLHELVSSAKTMTWEQRCQTWCSGAMHLAWSFANKKPWNLDWIRHSLTSEDLLVLLQQRLRALELAKLCRKRFQTALLKRKPQHMEALWPFANLDLEYVTAAVMQCVADCVGSCSLFAPECKRNLFAREWREGEQWLARVRLHTALSMPHSMTRTILQHHFIESLGAKSITAQSLPVTLVSCWTAALTQSAALAEQCPMPDGSGRRIQPQNGTKQSFGAVVALPAEVIARLNQRDQTPMDMLDDFIRGSELKQDQKTATEAPKKAPISAPLPALWYQCPADLFFHFLELPQDAGQDQHSESWMFPESQWSIVMADVLTQATETAIGWKESDSDFHVRQRLAGFGLQCLRFLQSSVQRALGTFDMMMRSNIDPPPIPEHPQEEEEQEEQQQETDQTSYLNRPPPQAPSPLRIICSSSAGSAAPAGYLLPTPPAPHTLASHEPPRQLLSKTSFSNLGALLKQRAQRDGEYNYTSLLGNPAPGCFLIPDKEWPIFLALSHYAPVGDNRLTQVRSALMPLVLDLELCLPKDAGYVDLLTPLPGQQQESMLDVMRTVVHSYFPMSRIPVVCPDRSLLKFHFHEFANSLPTGDSKMELPDILILQACGPKNQYTTVGEAPNVTELKSSYLVVFVHTISVVGADWDECSNGVSADKRSSAEHDFLTDVSQHLELQRRIAWHVRVELALRMGTSLFGCALDSGGGFPDLSIYRKNGTHRVFLHDKHVAVPCRMCRDDALAKIKERLKPSDPISTLAFDAAQVSQCPLGKCKLIAHERPMRLHAALDCRGQLMPSLSFAQIACATFLRRSLPSAHAFAAADAQEMVCGARCDLRQRMALRVSPRWQALHRALNPVVCTQPLLISVEWRAEWLGFGSSDAAAVAAAAATTAAGMFQMASGNLVPLSKHDLDVKASSTAAIVRAIQSILRVYLGPMAEIAKLSIMYDATVTMAHGQQVQQQAAEDVKESTVQKEALPRRVRGPRIGDSTQELTRQSSRLQQMLRGAACYTGTLVAQTAYCLNRADQHRHNGNHTYFTLKSRVLKVQDHHCRVAGQPAKELEYGSLLQADAVRAVLFPARFWQHGSFFSFESTEPALPVSAPSSILVLTDQPKSAKPVKHDVGDAKSSPPSGVGSLQWEPKPKPSGNKKQLLKQHAAAIRQSQPKAVDLTASSAASTATWQRPGLKSPFGSATMDWETT